MSGDKNLQQHFRTSFEANKREKEVELKFKGCKNAISNKQELRIELCVMYFL